MGIEVERPKPVVRSSAMVGAEKPVLCDSVSFQHQVLARWKTYGVAVIADVVTAYDISAVPVDKQPPVPQAFSHT
jgi:hypothetical protein